MKKEIKNIEKKKMENRKKTQNVCFFVGNVWNKWKVNVSTLLLSFLLLSFILFL